MAVYEVITGNSVLDAAIEEIRQNCNKMVLLDGYPASFSEANTAKGSGGLLLASSAMTSGDFTAAADASPDGRDTDVSAKSGLTAGDAGCGSVIALLDTVNSLILHQTPENLERQNTAQAGATGTITLDTGASAVDDAYNGMRVGILSGTGAGQERVISDYVGSTKVASVAVNWTTAPDATSVFVVYGRPVTGGDTVNIGGFTIRFAQPAVV